MPDNQTQGSVSDVQARQAQLCDVAQLAPVVNLAYTRSEDPGGGKGERNVYFCN